LLTATPHSGDTRSFASLCAIGEHGDRLLVFRRSRDAVRPGASRRIHRIAVQPSAAEARMHALLAEFSRAVRRDRGDNNADVWLALGVLHKRAYSSPHSLEQSVVRRLATLADPGGDPQQLLLPLDDRAGELDGADEAPAWNDALSLGNVARERQMLTASATAARLATARESKLAAPQRLLDRLGEPAVTFTEYRDTLP